LADLTASH